MTTTINASPTNGLVQTADGSGVLKVQSNGVTTNALAWVNFNGTGTVAIRSSYNVSSITDNGTGDYTVNFATALADANYAVNCNTATTYGRTIQVDSSSDTAAPTTQSTTAVRITAKSTSANATVDMANIYVSIFGN